MNSQNKITIETEKDKVDIPFHFSRIGLIKGEIFIELMTLKKYRIKSKVRKEILESFLKYWQDGILPTIDVNNCWEYNQLSEEFGLINEFSWTKYDKILKISRLKSISTEYQNQRNADISSIETSISNDLDFYLLIYPDDLFSIPITSLYNIFYKGLSNITDHNQAYNLIVKKGKDNEELFSLLSLFNTDNLSDEAIINCVLNFNDHNYISPQFTKSAFKFLIDYNKLPPKDLIIENFHIKQDLKDNERSYNYKIQELETKIKSLKEEIEGLKNDIKNIRKRPIKKTPAKKLSKNKKNNLAKSQIIIPKQKVKEEEEDNDENEMKMEQSNSNDIICDDLDE